MINFDNKINKEKIANETFVVSRYLDDYFGLIVLLLVLSLIISAYFLVCLPRYLEARDNINNVENSLLDEKNSLKRYKSQLTSYKEAYLGITDLDKTRVNEIIGPLNKYSSIYRTDLMINYRDLLGMNGFNLETINVEEITDVNVGASKKSKQAEANQVNTLPKGISKMLVKLKVKDINYDRFKELLQLLETELRIADIRDFNCQQGIASCELSLETYYFSPVEEK